MKQCHGVQPFSLQYFLIALEICIRGASNLVLYILCYTFDGALTEVIQFNVESIAVCSQCGALVALEIRKNIPLAQLI